MRANWLELKNFGRFRDFRTEFGNGGLVAFIGANGSGKSTLALAMKFALTGAINTEGTKDENVCQLAAATEPSWVRFCFSHGGATATITRYLRPSRPADMRIVGDNGAVEEISQDRRVTSRVEELLGVDQRIIDDIVMADQGAIFGFLAQTAAKRAEAFAKIFGTDVAEKLWKAIGEHVNSIRLAPDANLDGIRHSLQLCAERLGELQLNLGGDSSAAVQQRLAAISERYRQATLRDQTQARLQQLGQQREPLQVALTQAQAQATEYTNNVTLLETTIKSGESKVTDARLLLRSQEHAAVMRQQEANLRRTLEMCRATLAIDEPTPPANYHNDAIGLQGTIDAVVTMIKNYEQLLASFNPAKGLAACPTCGTSVANLQDKLQEAERELPAARLNLANLRKIQTDSATHRQNVHDYWTRRSEAAKQELEVANELQKLQVVLPSGDANAARQTLTEHDEYEVALRTYRGLSTTAAADVARLTGQLTQLTQTESQLRQALSGIIEQGGVVELSQEQGALQAWANQVATLEREQASLTAQRGVWQSQLQQAEANDLENRLNRAWLEQLTGARDLLHRDAAPAFVAQYNLRLLEQQINAHLELFDTEFRVAASEGLTFTARFVDGRVQPAGRLSGGQKVVLALAFRLAVNFMYSELGFMCLDEPTAYLDAHHIAGFEPVLNNLRELATSRGLQCLMITHEQSLANLFDHAIQL